jgi:hypothetical protein
MVAAEYFNQAFNLVMQVCSNKEQISRLERAVRGAKDSEERCCLVIFTYSETMNCELISMLFFLPSSC